MAKRQSRRGLEVYDKNPFVQNAITTTKTGTKRITNSTGDRMMIVSDQGEIVAPAGFHHVVEVDKTQFVKLYLGGVKAFQGLSNPGIKVFEIIYRAVQERPGEDTIHLHYAGIDQDLVPISEATFYRGIKELLEKQFIAESTIPNMYFLNVDYMFNGNRLAFIKEVRLKEENGKKITNQENLTKVEEETGQIPMFQK